mgnify:CR=1 FL=1
MIIEGFNAAPSYKYEGARGDLKAAEHPWMASESRCTIRPSRKSEAQLFRELAALTPPLLHILPSTLPLVDELSVSVVASPSLAAIVSSAVVSVSVEVVDNLLSCFFAGFECAGFKCVASLPTSIISPVAVPVPARPVVKRTWFRRTAAPAFRRLVGTGSPMFHVFTG